MADIDATDNHIGRVTDLPGAIRLLRDTKAGILRQVEAIVTSRDIISGSLMALREVEDVLAREVAERPKASHQGMLDESIKAACYRCKETIEQDDTVVYCPMENRDDEGPEARAVAHLGCYYAYMLEFVAELPADDPFKSLYLGIRTQAFLEFEAQVEEIKVRLVREGRIL
jgi:hypothetical protein